jgi:glycosyltransferase involved in cell wall biosynthesis
MPVSTTSEIETKSAIAGACVDSNVANATSTDSSQQFDEQPVEETIVCFASNYFFDPTSKHHVMRELAKTRHVLWVNWHASRRPSLNGRDLRGIWHKLKQIRRGVNKVSDRLWVVTPFVLPLPSSSLARWFNRLLVAMQLRWVLRKLPARRQVWSFTPDMCNLLGAFGEKKRVYYCVDEFSAFPGFDAETIAALDRRICEMSHLVITTSRPLYESKLPYNPDATIYVPHGVLYDRFAAAVSEDYPEAADLGDIPRPRIGFYGLIHEWWDLDLMAEIAKRRPDWSFVFVGQSNMDLSPYREIRNMHFVGQRPHEELPAYSRGFDVGVIPHKINKLTINMNPIKLPEYLAAGLPVVASSLPELEIRGDDVRIAETADEWISAIEQSLSVRSPELDRARSEAVSKDSWASRVKTILAALESVSPDFDSKSRPRSGE